MDSIFFLIEVKLYMCFVFYSKLFEKIVGSKGEK